MPISFKSLSIHQLLRHKKSYELIDEVIEDVLEIKSGVIPEEMWD